MSVVVIDPVSSGITYLNAAQELGVDIYVLSADEGERQLSTELRKKAREIIRIDTSNFEVLLAELDKLEDIRAILPGVEYSVPMAARLGAALGINCLSDQAVQRVRNKFNFRSQIADAELSNIGFFLINAGQPIQIPAGFLFPAVVKPVDMAGSISVCKVHNSEELTCAVNTFNCLLPNDVGFTSSGQLIVEEYIPGKEYSIEGIVCKNGHLTIASITEKLLGAEPYFVEIGHIVGQHYGDEFRTVITNYVMAVLGAVQLNIGPFHLELRVTPEGKPIAIELAARMPGDNIVELIKLAGGIDLAKNTLCEYLNMAKPVAKDMQGVSAIAFIPCREERVFTSIQGLTELINHPYYLTHQIYYKDGDKLSTFQDWASRVGYVMFAGRDETSIRNLVRQVHEEVKII